MQEAALDQAIVFSEEDTKLIITDVTRVIEQALLQGPEVAMQAGMRLRQGGQSRALAIAHLLYSLKGHWESFPTDDTFEDAVFKGMGLSRQTVDKYIRVWERIFASDTVNDVTKKALLGKPINSLLAVSAAAADGQISEAQWKDVVRAPDTSSVKEIVRQIRGRQTSSKNALVYTYERDGAIKYRRGGGHYKSLGFLPPTKDQDANEALDTLLRRAGVVRR